MTQLSQKVLDLPESATLAMAAKARLLKQQGKDIISLSIGEPDFNTPDFIKKVAIEAIEQDYNSYTPVDGYLELREAVCKKLLRDNQLNYNPDQVVVSTGAKQCLANLILALVNPGDEVLLPCPYWVSYSAISSLNAAKPVLIPSSINNRFKITPEDLKKHITSKTKIILFNSPNNPSGIVYSKREFEALAKILKAYPEIIIISDEIYEHINYGVPHFSLANVPELYSRTIVVNGLSKAFAMTGWRLGYMAGPEWVVKACKKVQGQFTSGANCITQRASITALESSPQSISYMVDAFRVRRKLILDLLSDIPGFKTVPPDGAFYVFPDISYYFGKKIQGVKINSANDLSMLLLEKANVATVSGTPFGQDNCIRLSYATSESNIKEAVNRIASVIA